MFDRPIHNLATPPSPRLGLFVIDLIGFDQAGKVVGCKQFVLRHTVSPLPIKHPDVPTKDFRLVVTTGDLAAHDMASLMVVETTSILCAKTVYK